MQDPNQILTHLRSLPAETEIVEFKEAKLNFDFSKLGKYFSALCNEANLKNKNEAWLIFGVRDKDKSIIGTSYRNRYAELHSLKSEIAAKTTAAITFTEIYEISHADGRVIMFQIPPAPRGIPIAWEGHYYGRNGEELSPLNLSEIEQIRSLNLSNDWSAQICNDAALEDLDPIAIKKARENYKNKFPDRVAEINAWDDITFLNKAKITIKGRITNSSIILLGKSEAEHFINPSEAKVRWILKDGTGFEKDYAIFSCPLVLNIDKIFEKIRNLKYRYMNNESIFPEEVDQYEPYVIREALNNCIAHQDYTKSGRINVIENPDELIFSNKGTFIPGTIENVIQADAPEESYRNPFLVTAMVNLNMVDTIGSGIKKMFTSQGKRYFPLPEYELGNEHVKVTIAGKIIDFNYARTLVQNPKLTLDEIILLDKVQKRKRLLPAELKQLREKGLIEGKSPNIIISAKVAQSTGQKAKYTRLKAFDKNHYFHWIIRGIEDHGSLNREEIDELLMVKLSDHYDTDKKRKAKITNLISELRLKGQIKNIGSDRNPKWILAPPPF